MDFEAAIRGIQDTPPAIGEIQARMANIRKEQAEGPAADERRMNHIDERLAEIADNLDGLIGFMDNFIRNRPDFED